MGEAAMRLIHAVREYNREFDRNLTTLAFYTDPEKRAMFVREADEAYSLGPATYTMASGQRKSSYLDYERLSEALEATRADAAWAGWGFVAEHAEFADLWITGDEPERIASTLLGQELAVGPVGTLRHHNSHVTEFFHLIPAVGDECLLVELHFGKQYHHRNAMVLHQSTGCGDPSGMTAHDLENKHFRRRLRH